MDTVHYQPLGRKTFFIFVLQRIAPAFAFLIFYVFSFFNSGALGPQVAPVLVFINQISLVCMPLFLGIGFLVAWLVYHFYRYALDDHALRIKKGILYKEELAIPYRQIQNVSLEQSLVHRLIGVSRLVILTAGEDQERHASETEGFFPVIDSHIARAIQGEILRRANIQEVVSVEQKLSSAPR